MGKRAPEEVIDILKGKILQLKSVLRNCMTIGSEPHHRCMMCHTSATPYPIVVDGVEKTLYLVEKHADDCELQNALNI